MTKKIILAIVIFALVAAGVVGFFVFKNNSSSDNLFLSQEEAALNDKEAKSAPADMPTTEPSVNLPNDLVEYKNNYYKFKLNYPATLAVSEFAENSGGRTILFESRLGDEVKGFQIFITPYKYSQITKERFRMDEPSGIINQPTNVVIDGLPGTMFYSKNSLMGDTREVWFINNGFLYEVVTYKNLDGWLSQIMATWQFTS
jgi:hypothetical protein